MSKPLYGIQCGTGWASLYEPILKQCEEKNIPIAQIKEKFGGLRIYTDRHDDAVESMIRDAEDRSFVTCEECGEPGELRYDGWRRTLCDKHYAERLAAREEK